MCFQLLKLVLLALILTASNGHLATKRLYEDLLSDYNRLIRPVANNNDTIYVNLSLKLTQLLDINMKQQVMSTNVWVEQNWFDFQLKWDPKEYDGVDSIYIPADDIWQPDIVLFNKFYWKPPALFKSTCEIDVEYFPFDIQTCSMKFASWTYDGLEVDLRSVDKSYSVKVNYTSEPEPARLIQASLKENLNRNNSSSTTTSTTTSTPTTPSSIAYDRQVQSDFYSKSQKAASGSEIVEIGIDMSEFYTSVEWDVLGVPAHYRREYFAGFQNPYPDITFKIRLRRKTLFYTVNLIIPIVGNAFMTLLVFFLPSDSGEKVALSISLLVSLTVFFLLLAEIIPPTSLAVPLLGKYLLFTMILITLSICCTVVVLNIHYRSLSTHIMQPWLRRFFIEILPKYLLMHRPTIKDLQKELRALSKPNKFQFTSCTDLDATNDHTLRLLPAPAARSYYGYEDIQSTNTSLDEQLNKSAFIYNFNLNQPELSYDTDLGMPSLIFPQIQPRNFVSSNEQLDEGTIKRPASLGSSPTVAKEEHEEKEIVSYGPDVEQAIQSILAIAEHIKREDEEKNVIEDWKFVAMSLDRLFFVIFTIICVLGSIILLQSPSLYDLSPAIESPSLKLKNLLAANGS